MTERKFPVNHPPRKRRRSARRASFPAPASLRLGAVEATVARELVGQIARLSSVGPITVSFSSLSAERFARIEAIASDLSELLEGGGVSAQQHTDVDGGAGVDAPAPFSLEAQ